MAGKERRKKKKEGSGRPAPRGFVRSERCAVTCSGGQCSPALFLFLGVGFCQRRCRRGLQKAVAATISLLVSPSFFFFFTHLNKLGRQHGKGRKRTLPVCLVGIVGQQAFSKRTFWVSVALVASFGGIGKENAGAPFRGASVSFFFSCRAFQQNGGTVPDSRLLPRPVCERKKKEEGRGKKRRRGPSPHKRGRRLAPKFATVL